jgi:proline dehydrogenase
MKILHWIVKNAARSYIAGTEAEDAIRVCRRIAEHGLRSTICPWDGPQDSSEKVASTYKAALNSITDKGLDCYLSIKVPSIKYDIAIMAELVEIAREKSIRIHFDSLDIDTAARSLTLLERTFNMYHNVSYTLPSRWRRSIDDAERIIALGIPVRVVKGQWRDANGPDIDPDINYIRLIDVLQGRASCVAVATHDVRLAKESLYRLKDAGTNCELEQLYGLPMRIESVAEPLNVPVRIYVPYGQAYLSYALSAIRKRPILLAWLLRDFIRGVQKR